MAKGSGTTRASGSRNPQGMTAQNGGNVRRSEYDAAMQNIDEQVDELNNAIEELDRQLSLDPDNSEYYESQIDEFSNDIELLEIERRRIRTMFNR